MTRTVPAPLHAQEGLTHIDFYMDDIISTVKGGLERQHRLFDGTVCALKWLFLYLPGNIKDWSSVENLLAGEGEWTCVEEVLG